LVADAAKEHDWIHYAGPQFGDSVARFFSLAQVFLLPGAVGLAVVDSFVFGTPLVTTTAGHHGPEIAYLEPGVNGVIVEGDGSGGTYASAVAKILTDESLRQSLGEGCRRSVDRHRIEAMVEHFADGVVKALGPAPMGQR